MNRPGMFDEPIEPFPLNHHLSRRSALGAVALAAVGLTLPGGTLVARAAERSGTGTISNALKRDQIEATVAQLLANQPAADLHTHCYSPRFTYGSKPGGLLLFGIDELLTYHYLVAEVFRVVPPSQLSYERFWSMTKPEQANHIWKNLFVDRTPLSEACRGVLTTLSRLGLDPNEKDLNRFRKWFAAQEPDAYIDKVMQLANVDQITMTNPVFDDVERAMWERDPEVGGDSRFKPVLRCDQLLTDWPWVARKLASWGYQVREDLGGQTMDEVKRWLGSWLDRMKSTYLAMSLPPDWEYPNVKKAAVDRLMCECLLPALRERGLPWALMIGVNRGVNPLLRDGGDGGGRGDVQSVANVCRDFPENKFLVTMLSLENQHELCVAARKFGNLMIFGCWWFLNNPSQIEAITRMRVEMLGTTFVAQHSDARILEQLIYKWEHNRRIIGKVLTEEYLKLSETGLALHEPAIRQDIGRLLRENYRNFLRA